MSRHAGVVLNVVLYYNKGRGCEWISDPSLHKRTNNRQQWYGKRFDRTMKENDIENPIFFFLSMNFRVGNVVLRIYDNVKQVERVCRPNDIALYALRAFAINPTVVFIEHRIDFSVRYFSAIVPHIKRSKRIITYNKIP